MRRGTHRVGKATFASVSPGIGHRQDKRRHLDASQRATCAVETLPLLEEEAKQRQREHGGTAPGRKRTLTQKIAEVKGSGEARQQAASLFGTNRQYVSEANKLKEESPEVFEKVKEGKLAKSGIAVSVHGGQMADHFCQKQADGVRIYSP